MPQQEFQEIGHSGGKVTFNVVTDVAGNRAYNVTFSHSRPVASALFAVWALPQGVAVAGINMGGIGTPWNPPPVPGCLPVMIGSDSEGMFGHTCHACKGYWRSRGGVVMCPYCAAQGDKHMFLTPAQQQYIQQYCATLEDALANGQDGNYTIDMDAVADAIGKDTPKPDFYYAEERQQKHSKCDACGSVTDILGKYCYCPQCGTRNDLFELQNDLLPRLRERINERRDFETCVADIVGAFDTFARLYAKQLAARVPLKPTRIGRLQRMLCHNLESVASEFDSGFEIDVLAGISPDDFALARRSFFRRHVYEHNGGVVDQKYLDDSGDNTVRLGQEIRETQNDAHRLVGIVSKMAENLHRGFHEIFPPIEEPIKHYASWRPDRVRMPAS